MRVLNKDCWDVVLLHITYAEWKQCFRKTGHSFITLYEQLVPHVITLFLRHCTCAVLSSFGFQSDQVFTCPLVRITKGINHPLRSDWRVYMWLFYSDYASSPIMIGLYGPCKRSYCCLFLLSVNLRLLIVSSSDEGEHDHAAPDGSRSGLREHTWRRRCRDGSTPPGAAGGQRSREQHTAGAAGGQRSREQHTAGAGELQGSEHQTSGAAAGV